MKTLLVLASSYLLGAVPFAVWIGRFRSGIDPREHGSRNPGATNILRLLGWRWAVPVLVLDAAKGWVAVALIAGGFFGGDSALPAAAGLASVVGHVWPVFAGFRGGKGVATAAGVFLALDPFSLAAAFVLFVLVVLTTGRVSAGSISAALALPVIVYLRDEPRPGSLLLAGIFALLITFSHRANVRLLLAGREPRWTVGRGERD